MLDVFSTVLASICSDIRRDFFVLERNILHEEAIEGVTIPFHSRSNVHVPTIFVDFGFDENRFGKEPD